MNGMGKVMHSPSYMQTHAPAHRCTHTYSWSLTPFTKEPHTDLTLVASHVFPFAIVYVLNQISHTQDL